MKLKVKRLEEGAVLPVRATKHSAGLDIFAISEVTLLPNEDYLMGTGIAMEIPEGCVGLVYARSGMSVKHGIVMKNAVGVIDSDYRGELKVPLRNISNAPFKIEKHSRIAQMVVTPYLSCEVVEAEELDGSERGEGGFGSTGTHFSFGKKKS